MRAHDTGHLPFQSSSCALACFISVMVASAASSSSALGHICVAKGPMYSSWHLPHTSGSITVTWTKVMKLRWLATNHSLAAPAMACEVSCGGAARQTRSDRVAGASAVLWGQPVSGEDRRVLVTAEAALSDEQYAPMAEAWGLRVVPFSALRVSLGIILQLCVTSPSRGGCTAQACKCCLSSPRLEMPCQDGLLNGWPYDGVLASELIMRRRRHCLPQDAC